MVTRFARLKIRRDTAADWTTEDPTLLEGEFAYESDTKQMKVGDGVTAWASLGYVAFATTANHNTLSDLQGGTADEYYHLTEQQHSRLSPVSAYGATLIDDADAATARATLGVEIGSDVQGYDAGLTSIAGLTTAADKMIYTTALDTYAVTDLTAYGRSLLDDANAAAARTTLELGSIATQQADSVTITGGTIAGIADLAIADGGTGASTAGTARNNLGLEIGSNVQAYDAALASIAGLTTAADRMIYTTALDSYTVTPLTAFARTLLDDVDQATMQATLGLLIGSNVQAFDSGLTSIAALATSADKMIYTTSSDVYAVSDLTPFARTLLDDADAATARATLGVSLGSDVQPYDAGLTSIAGLTTAANEMIYTTASDTYAVTALTAFARTLLNDGDAATARATLDSVGGAATLTTQYRMPYVDAAGLINESTTLTTDASGNLSINANISLVNCIHYATAFTPPAHAEGITYWDQNDNTLALMTDVTGTVIQVGQELVVKVINNTGSPLSNGDVVYVDGAQGGRPTVAKADADLSNAQNTIGIVTSDAGIAHTAEGYVVLKGILRGYDTSSFTTGQALYLSQTTGEITNVEPAYPANSIRVAYALNSIVDGSLYVDVDANPSIDEIRGLLHNSITGLQGGTTDEYYHFTETQHTRLSPVSAYGATLIDDADAATARTTLGVVIGTDVQAYDAGLQSIAGLTTAADNMIYTTALDTYAVTSLTAFARTLLDDGDATTARATLGAASAADLTTHTSDTNNPHTTTLELARTAGATFAGNVAMGGSLITGHGSPSIGTDVVNKDYVDNLFDGRKYKDPVVVATTGDVTLSGEQTIDGVLTSNSRVLVWQQTDGTENGIYVTAPGAWARSSDADTGDEIVGMITNALTGTAYADREFYCTNTGISLGVTAITIVLRATVTNHNNLAGLQGGTAAEYYHLTNTQHSALITTVSNLTTQYRIPYVNSAGVLTESTSIVTDASGNLSVAGVAQANTERTTTLTSAAAFETMPLIARDTTAMATGVGGGITFQGQRVTGGAFSNFGAIWTEKENATSGNYAASLILGTGSNALGYPARALTLDSLQNATFAGKATVNASDGQGVRISRPSVSDNEVGTLTFGYGNDTWFSASMEAKKLSGGGSDIYFYTGIGGVKNANPTLTLDSSQNATFAGNITMPSGGFINDGTYTAGSKLTFGNDVTLSANRDLFFNAGAVLALTLDSSQNATFAGAIDIALNAEAHTTALTLTNNSANAYSADLLWHTGYGSGYDTAKIKSEGEDAFGGNLIMYTANTSKVLTEAMRINTGGNVLIGTATQVGTALLTVDGYIAQQGVFAEIYVMGGSTAQSIPTGATFTKITGYTNDGQSSNCTADVANDKVTVTKAGKYRVSGKISFSSGTTNVVWTGAAFAGGTEQNNVHFERQTGNQFLDGDVSFNGFIDVTADNTDIDFRIKHDNGAAVNFTAVDMNLNVEMVGTT